MANDLSVQRKSIVGEVANRYGMEPDTFEATIRATCMPADPPATREEFAAFLVVCKEHGLNPVTREIYAMRRKGGAGLIPVVSVDGWLKKINEHPQFDGMEFTENLDEAGGLVSTTCRLFRKDRQRPIEVTEWLAECVRPTEPWKMKHRMLRHKSLIQAGRYAFGFAGIYDEDEAERFAAAAPRDVTPPDQQPRAAARSAGPPRGVQEAKVIEHRDESPMVTEVRAMQAEDARMDPLPKDIQSGETVTIEATHDGEKVVAQTVTRSGPPRNVSKPAPAAPVDPRKVYNFPEIKARFITQKNMAIQMGNIEPLQTAMQDLLDAHDFTDEHFGELQGLYDDAERELN